jgi:CRP-like cAMP-binding protein
MREKDVMNMLRSLDINQLITHRRTVAPEEVIFLDGHEADCAYVILQGEVQIAVTEAGGRLLVINRMHEGEMFGEIALLQENGKRTAMALSQNGCELAVIDRDVFHQHLNDADPFLRFVIAHLCQLVMLWTDRVRRA